ncbi:hypothetical protein ECO103_4902 [Escherichia coli O103:H2 str. 12009]|nr:hypothetical protein ECO103_3576 [Escherichia coli O103:H2 str. 12009]BAI33587.1 hypothetical protein ECO103_4902 [Escherichia coli O103:H2 str. 12009]
MFDLSYIFIIPIRQSYPIGDTCRLPARNRLTYCNRLPKQLCNYQNAGFSPILTKIIPSLSRVRAEASFRGSHRVSQHHAPCLSPGRNIPLLIFYVSPRLLCRCR